MAGPFSCELCGAKDTVAMPGDIAVRVVRCSACGVEQPVNRYASGAQQLFEEMARVEVAKAEQRKRRAEGVICEGCGGTMTLPGDPLVDSFRCPYCGRQHLVSAFVDAKLLANQRLRTDLRARIAEAERQGGRRDRLVLFIVIVVVALGGAIFAVTRLAGG